MTTEQLIIIKNECPTFDECIDIKNIGLDMNASAVSRAEEYLRQVMNPYHFRIGDIAVNVEFTEGRKSLGDCVKSYLMG